MTPRRCPRGATTSTWRSIPPWCCGSEGELLSALGNLVSNAVRYTPDGGRIAIRMTYTDGHSVFSVSDTGLGIAPEHIPRLTERFYRVDRSRSRDTGGTGLGLAIVKHVLSRHHADLRVTSEVGRGSTFRIVFPVDRSGYEPDRHSRCRNWAMPRVTPPDINCTLLQRIQYKGPLPFGEAAAFCKVRLGAEPRQQLCLAYALLLGARWLAHILAVRLHDPRRGVVAQMHLQPSLITRALSVRSSIGKATSTRRNRLRSIQSALDRYSTSSPPAWK
jgi:anti-sigma regulatory factor (Ser/Thr protein kinase)